MVLLFILVSSLAEPYFYSINKIDLYRFSNMINSKICHQHPPRCSSLFDSNLGLCARCFAFYSTMLFFVLINSFVNFNLSKKIKNFMFILLNFPLVLDGVVQLLTTYESNFVLRTITGMFSGIGVSIILLPFYTKLINSTFSKN